MPRLRFNFAASLLIVLVASVAQAQEMLDNAVWRQCDDLTDSIQSRAAGQSFLSHFANLSRIDVRLFKDQGPKTASLTLHLRESPDAGDIAVARAQDAKISGRGWLHFHFPPIKDSKGRGYYFYLEPTGEEDSGIRARHCMRTSLYDRSQQRERYENHQKVEGSLDFRTYVSFEGSAAEAASMASGRWASDKLFAALYSILLLAVVIGILMVGNSKEKGADG
jgi:hypothetical protein